MITGEFLKLPAEIWAILSRERVEAKNIDFAISLGLLIRNELWIVLWGKSKDSEETVMFIYWVYHK